MSRYCTIDTFVEPMEAMFGEALADVLPDTLGTRRSHPVVLPRWRLGETHTLRMTDPIHHRKHRPGHQNKSTTTAGVK